VTADRNSGKAIFTAPTDISLAAPGPGKALVVIAGSHLSTHALPLTGSVIIGRSPDCDVVIDEPSVSRQHARLDLGQPFFLTDLGSTHGSSIGGARLGLGEAAEIRVGVPFEVGRVTLMLREAGPVFEARADEPPARAVGADDPMAQARDLVLRVAAGTISVLIIGETGVGKELMAETVHRHSPRAAGPFVKLNCAALTESLLESELFGHEKGAFTGATAVKKGLLEAAHGGSVFLDEVGELPLPLQVKLLRAVEERMIRKVGGLEPRPIDVRFIAATNRDLHEEIARGSFREDLYYRLAGATVYIPPLRERTGEIEPLARSFLERAAGELGRQVPALGDDALAWLLGHAWPGNVRELRNTIERAILLAEGGGIRAEHVATTAAHRPAAPAGYVTPVPPAAPEVATSERSATMKEEVQREVEAIERQRILEALDECAGNQTRAAKLLGMSRRALINRLDAYDIPRPRKGPKKR